jgi:hypothetical protein
VHPPRRGHEHEPRGVKLPEGAAQHHPAVAYPEVEAGAARDGEVALTRIEGALLHGEPIDHLGEHEVEVGVALSVHVGHVVDQQAPDGKLHVLPVLRVKASQEELVRLALSPVLREVEARRQGEKLRRAAPRHGPVRVHRHAVLARAPAPRGAPHHRRRLGPVAPTPRPP